MIKGGRAPLESDPLPLSLKKKQSYKSSFRAGLKDKQPKETMAIETNGDLGNESIYSSGMGKYLYRPNNIEDGPP